LSLCIFVVTPVQAQDVFSANSGGKDCQSASAEEYGVMADHRAALQKESLDIQNQYEKDVLACPQPPGGASCRQAAWDRRVASQVQLHLKKSDENARHDKAMVDIDTTYCHPGHAAQQATAPSESSNESSNQGQPPLLKGQISETADDSANAMLHAINSTLDR
jgi:hypothetical protein